MLSEENHVLFEQITLLRAQLEYQISEYSSKTEEAHSKIIRFDSLEQDLKLINEERVSLVQANESLEKRIFVQLQVVA